MRSVDRAKPAGQGVAHEDVLGHRQVGEQSRLLMDRGDAERPSMGGSVEQYRLAVEQDGPGIGLVDAGQHLDDRALACAVLTDEPMYLARQ